MQDLTQILTKFVLVLVCAAVAVPVIAAPASPGETSAPPLAPLLVTSYDKASGDLHLAYQSACGATGNTIYYAPMGQAGSPAWSGNDCSAGVGGSHAGFDPGAGSYFFVVVGNDGTKEGSYGKSRIGVTLAERTPRAANTCGLVQDLANACTPAGMGAACTSNADCGARTSCVANVTGSATCACLPPFTGAYCQQCAPGYAGADCRSCAPGFVGNATQSGDSGDAPIDRTNPETFRCEADVPGTCTGVSCGGHGSCVVSGRDAMCACQPGYTGASCSECAPNFGHDATGACVLGAACREAKCGGHGNCLAASFGDVVCQCDSGYNGADCGGALRVVSSSEASSLYAGESVVLTPQGGVGPFTWRLDQGNAQLTECPARNTDPSCPTGSVKITAPPVEPLTDGLLLIRYMFGATSGGPQTAVNLTQIPSTFLPMSGAIHSELVPFYNAMQKYMRGRGIRGGVLGLSKGGTIIASNGYGYRDTGLDSDPFINAGEGGPIVQPQSPFRIASVTKTMTAAAVRQAAADAGVNITSAAAFHRAASWVEDSIGFDLVNGNAPYDYNLGGTGTDSRWGNVTIQHLLNHHVGFWRDSVLAPAQGLPPYNGSLLPFTADNTPSGLQNAVSGFSNDISYATSHVLAGLQLSNDPRVTVKNTILFAAGNTFQYPPGGNIGAGDNYANIGYQLAGRVLEGLNNVTYNPDDPSAPEGWGRFPTLLQNYLCESSGIQTGIWPGDAFHPRAFEPYYRDIAPNLTENLDWNLAQSSKIRFNNGAQKWEFCQSGCGGQNETWGTSANTPTAYGGVWLAQRNSAGGLVATTDALLRFARNHRVKVGSPNDGANGIGSILPAPGVYGSGGSHNGALPGTSSLLWQMGGNRTNQLPVNVGAWELDDAVSLPLDVNGNVRINEVTYGASSCALPNDVTVAVMFNQRQDRRAPATLLNPNFNATGNSSNGTVYGRIVDFLGDAACDVNSDGWPALAEPQAQIQMQPVCN